MLKVASIDPTPASLRAAGNASLRKIKRPICGGLLRPAGLFEAGMPVPSRVDWPKTGPCLEDLASHKLLTINAILPGQGRLWKTPDG
jgi:hypothetical protein